MTASREQIGTGDPDGMEFGSTFATAADPKALTYDGAKAFAMYNTCASTNASTSFEPVLINTVMTGAGQVGGRVKINMSTNVALGGWANALKVQVECNTAGRATGLLSVFCAEMVLPASDVSGVGGTYAPLEVELNCPTSHVSSAATSFAFFGLGGNATAIHAFNDVGSLFHLSGFGAAAAGHVFDTCVATPPSHSLRINIDGVAYYILLTNNVDDT